ncbi:uncharacterized protein LODBEIA_P41850 [Lodderomyces beijingensis]|uniref:DNA-binding protein REB1 n=1 Tax=Lodderomyces beijingensis TaxID=1775926 RepID=A0ABP0ZSN8_9ASCO
MGSLKVAEGARCKVGGGPRASYRGVWQSEMVATGNLMPRVIGKSAGTSTHEPSIGAWQAKLIASECVERGNHRDLMLRWATKPVFKVKTNGQQMSKKKGNHEAKLAKRKQANDVKSVEQVRSNSGKGKVEGTVQTEQEPIERKQNVVDITGGNRARKGDDKKRKKKKSEVNEEVPRKKSKKSKPNQDVFDGAVPSVAKVEKPQESRNKSDPKMKKEVPAQSKQRDSSGESSEQQQQQQQQVPNAAHSLVEEKEEGNNSVQQSPSKQAQAGGSSASSEASSHDFNKVIDEDHLVSITAQKSNEWFEQNSASPTKTKSRPFLAEENAIIDYYLAGVCHFRNWNRDQLCRRIWNDERVTDNFWIDVRKAFPYRSNSSIYKHIRRKYHIFDARGKWTKDEDAQLSNLAIVNPSQWKKIGEIMGRMPEDCRDRWRNYLKCGDARKSQRWSRDEEERLVDAVNEIIQDLRELGDSSPLSAEKVNWTIVSEKMDGQRSRLQCRDKWSSLNETASRIHPPRMGHLDKLWLLKRLKKKNYSSADDIQWGKLMRKYANDIGDKPGWQMQDFQNYLRDEVLPLGDQNNTNGKESSKMKFQKIVKQNLDESTSKT